MLYDLWAWISFQYSKWEWGDREDGIAQLLAWLLVALAGIIAGRVYRTKRGARFQAENQGTTSPHLHPGTDFELYRIEKRLQELGVSRHQWEPLSQWLQRAHQRYLNILPADAFQGMIRLHYRYRFDPKGLGAQERETLRDMVQSWLTQLKGNHELDKHKNGVRTEWH